MLDFGLHKEADLLAVFLVCNLTNTLEPEKRAVISFYVTAINTVVGNETNESTAVRDQAIDV